MTQEDLCPPLEVIFPTLRDFQVNAHVALKKGFLAGHKNQLVMAATGAGKTMLAMWLIHEALRKGRRALFVADRTALIDQTSAVADKLGLTNHGVIQADHWRRDMSRPFQIASVQTLAKRGFWPDTDLVFVDEAHCQYAAVTDFIQSTDRPCIGLSGTPFSKGLGKLYTNLVNVTSMHELVTQGILVPMRVYSCTRADMTGAKLVGGEWTDQAAAERGTAILGDVVTEWLKYSPDRKSIAFGATIQHCKDMCSKFLDAGVMAAVYTSETKDDERTKLLAEFAKPDSMIRVLISVAALEKGFDQADVSCVIDCRPLRKSLSSAMQMWGRGMRSFPGKTDCHLHDHSGNIIRMAEDYTNIYFDGLASLDDGEKLDKKARDDKEADEVVEKGCPSCGYTPFFKRCMSCGYEKGEPSHVAHEDGVMQEVVIGKRKLADNQRHLWNQLCSYVREHGKPETRRGRAWHLYKKIVGTEPPKAWSFELAPQVEVSRNVHNQITHHNMRWLKGRQKGAMA